METQQVNSAPKTHAQAAQEPALDGHGALLTASRLGDHSMGAAANSSPAVQQLMAYQSAANACPMVRQLKSIQSGISASLQRKSDEKQESGLPAQLQAGIEQLSGQSMAGVQVHMNSSKPAQLQAHAFAQGNEIHVAPGQERHLPHEAWHVAQQKQGRVKATTEMGGNPVNDSPELEMEADSMGAKAMQLMAIGSEPAVAPSYEPEVQEENEIESEESANLEAFEDLSDEELIEELESTEAEEQEVDADAPIGAPVQMARTNNSGRQTTRKKKNTASKGGIPKASKTIKRKARTPKKANNNAKPRKYTPRKPKGSVIPTSGSRYGGHDSTGNKKALLDVVNHRTNNSSVSLNKLSIPETLTFNSQNFGKQNTSSDDKMSNGTAICHKLAESEVFKSIEKLIKKESKSKDKTELDNYLVSLMDYIDPKHMTNDNVPQNGNYESEVKSKHDQTKFSYIEFIVCNTGDDDRRETAHKIGKMVVNSPVNLFNGSSSVNSSIQEHLDGNKYELSDNSTPLTPRSQRAKQVQSNYSGLIEGPKKDGKNKDMSSSLL